MMVTAAVDVQLFASLTVTVYVPATRFVEVTVVCPFDHVYVYEGVPPDGVTVAEPLLPPLHETWVDEEIEDVSVAGWVIVIEAVVLQLFASLTVTE